MSQNVRSGACVIAQQYSSTLAGSSRFHARKEKFSARKMGFYFNFVLLFVSKLRV